MWIRDLINTVYPTECSSIFSIFYFFLLNFFFFILLLSIFYLFILNFKLINSLRIILLIHLLKAPFTISLLVLLVKLLLFLNVFSPFLILSQVSLHFFIHLPFIRLVIGFIQQPHFIKYFLVIKYLLRLVIISQTFLF